MNQGAKQQHLANVNNDHRPNVPSPKVTKNAVQPSKGKGKGK
jgi:hypothetical protein